MTLPAFAADHRAAAPLLLTAGARLCRSICPARRAHSSKPAAAAAGRDRQMDGHPAVL